MNILALDNATRKCGVCVLRGYKVVYFGKIEQNDKSIEKRLQGLYGAIRGLIRKWHIDVVVYEDTNKCTNVQVLKSLCVLQGIIMALAFEFDIKHVALLPSVWRKVLGFKTGSHEGTTRDVQKQMALDYVNCVLNLPTTSDDVAEAICIGQAFIKLNNLEEL